MYTTWSGLGVLFRTANNWTSAMIDSWNYCRLPIFACKTSLYLETSWTLLCTRHKVARLKTMYNVDNNTITFYTKDIFIVKRYNTTGHSKNYSLPKYRLQLYKTSLMPTVI